MKPRICLMMIIGVLSGLHQAVAQVNFAPATNYAVRGNPSSIIAADINGDG